MTDSAVYDLTLVTADEKLLARDVTGKLRSTVAWIADSARRRPPDAVSS